MPPDAPEFVFGAPELGLTLLAVFIIGAIIGPKWLREQRKKR